MRTIRVSVRGARGLAEDASSRAVLTLPGSEPVESELVSGSAEPAFGLEAEWRAGTDDASLTRLVTTPALVRLVDATGASLGECSLPLEPMLACSSLEETWLPLGDSEDGPAVLVAAVAEDQPPARARALLTEDERDESTCISFDLHALHRLPEAWRLEEGQTEDDHAFTYTATVRCAVADTTFRFEGGRLVVPPASKEEEEAPASDTSPESRESGPPSPAKEEEDAAAGRVEWLQTAEGGGLTKTEAEERVARETEEKEALEGQHIAWSGATATLFLGVEACRRLRSGVAEREKAMAKRVELEGKRQLSSEQEAELAETKRLLDELEPPLRVSVLRLLKDPAKASDPNAARYAAICTPDLAKLAAVGSTSCEGRFRITHDLAYAPDEGDEAAKPPPAVEPLEEPAEGAPHPYEVAGTLLRLDLRTSAPLNPRPPPPPPPLPKTSDMIPRRTLPALAPKTSGAEFEAQVKGVVEELAAEWSVLFPEVPPDTDDGSEAKETRRRELLHQLDASGKFFAFKERLKRAVVRLARESTARPTGEPPDEAQQRVFYNDLYVALLRRMHAALDATFFPPAVPPSAPSAPSALDGTPPEAALATLASEAEAEFRLEAAANYHHERVATAPTIAAAWLAYGTFLLRTGRGAKAEECSREAIAVDPEYAEAMLVHGVTLASRSNHEQAEPFLRAALDAAPEDAQLWLLMAVVYERMERGRDARVALRQASTLLGEGSETGPHYLALAQRLLPYAASPLIDEALERAGGTDTLAANLVRAEMLLQRGELAPAETVLLAASEAAPRPRAAPALTLLGHAQLRQGKAAEARATYERALSLCGAPLPAPLLLHLGAVCQSEGDAARARHLFLHASRLSPSCTSWLGAGVACLALELYDEAEQCLCEANILDNRRPDVWGQLALLCQRRDRTVEAEEALEQATRLNLADGKLLVAIGAAFFDGGVWAAAEGCFRRALAVDATPLTMQRLADSLLEQQSYKEALAAYRRAMQAVAEDAAGAVAQACGRQIKRVLAHMGLPEDDQDDSEQLPLDGTTG